MRLRVVRAAEVGNEVARVAGEMLGEFAQAWTAANPGPAR